MTTIHTYYTDGEIATDSYPGRDGFATLAEVKRASIRAVASTHDDMMQGHVGIYRVRITEAESCGVWDTDDVFGITPQDRDETTVAAEPRMHHGDGDEPLPADEMVNEHIEPWAWPTPPPLSPVDAAELARIYYRFTRDHPAKASLKRTLALLDWPMDGWGLPLRPTADEC